MIILILIIGQLFILKCSPSDLHVAFAQSTNATSLLVPSNMNKSSCFKSDVLTALQRFNDHFGLFSAALSDIFTRYEELVKTNERDAGDRLKAEIANMDIGDLNEVAKETIDLLRKNI
jgi:hypothetical protein